MRKKGRFNILKEDLGGIPLTKEDLKLWRQKVKTLNKEIELLGANASNVAQKYFKQYPNVAAYFDSTQIPPTIFYKEGVSNFVLEHEFYHAEEFTKIGKENFLEGEIGSFVTPLTRMKNTILREKYVVEKIFENASKFTKAELEYTKWYYRQIVIKATEKGVEIIPEFIVRF